MLPIDSKLTCRLLLLSVLPFISLSSHAYVDDPVDTSMILATVDYSYTDLDNARGFQNTGLLGASLGLSFSPAFTSTLYYSRALIKDDSSRKFSFEHFYLEGLFYFVTNASIRPYFATGLGELQQEQGKIADETLIHLGVGLHWQLNEKWAIRTDWRLFHSLDDDLQDQALRTSLVYRFGQGEK